MGLRVVRKRSDGYHDLETIFVPIYRLHDELEIQILPDKGHSICFYQEGISIDCPTEDNLIVKCFHIFASKYAKIGSVSVRLKKRIPFGAGLGGGSSDAAHMAKALNELFELGLSKAQLAAEVKVLGADCPFFIYNTPCYAEGIGDILSPIDLDMRDTRIVMIKPNENVSTREAYQGIKPNPLPFDRKTNDFEQTVFPIHPQIAIIKKRLLDAGAYYACMSGSGSTVFGLFKNDPEGSSNTRLRTLKEEFAAMVLLDDTFGEWQA